MASKEEPLNDPGNIRITKIQKGDATDMIPSLEGTQFTIKYYDDMNLTKAQVSSATPKRTWIITTKRDSRGRYIAKLEDSYLVNGSHDLYKSSDGVPIIPLGTITIQETNPAPGYVLDGSGYLSDLNGNKVSTDTDFYLSHIVNSTSGVMLQGGNEYTGYNSTYPLSVKVVKYDSDGKTPLADVQYTIKDKDGNDVKDKNGNVIQPKTTNSSGVATFENLYPNVYYITEIKTKAGLQLLKDPITVNAPMRMTKDEATANKLDVSDTSKVVWSDAENCYLECVNKCL